MKTLLTTIFLVTASIVFAQTEMVSFTVSSHDVELGKTLATKTIAGNKTHIKVVTDIKVHMLFTIHVKIISNSTLINNVLISSSAVTYNNGDIHSTTTIIKNGSHYNIKKGEHSYVHQGDITYCGALLYFKEPKGLTHVLSEISGEENASKSMGNGDYLLTIIEEEHHNIYSYKSGLLQTASIEHSMSNVQLKRD